MSRGKVFKIRNTWYCEVYSGGRLVVRDNTGAWEPMMRYADSGARAVAQCERWGHTFKHTWDELVAKAANL